MNKKYLEKNPYQNPSLRSQERPLSFLADHDGDMEKTKYFLTS